MTPTRIFTFLIKNAVVMTLLLLIWSASQAQMLDKVAERFRNNVLQITTLNEDSKQKSGFGFVVAERGDKLYVVTAKHVFSTDNPDIKVKIQVQFYERQGSPYDAKLLLSSKELDVAMIEASKPVGYKWERKYFYPRPKRNDKVCFIGRGQKWYIPTDSAAGQVNRISSSDKLHIDMKSVQSGTSGAPLISRNGIVGMIIRDSGVEVEAIGIETIRKVVTKEWIYPWGLEENTSTTTTTTIPTTTTTTTIPTTTTTTIPTTTTTTTIPTTTTTTIYPRELEEIRQSLSINLQRYKSIKAKPDSNGRLVQVIKDIVRDFKAIEAIYESSPQYSETRRVIDITGIRDARRGMERELSAMTQ